MSGECLQLKLLHTGRTLWTEIEVHVFTALARGRGRQGRSPDSSLPPPAILQAAPVPPSLWRWQDLCSPKGQNEEDAQRGHVF